MFLYFALSSMGAFASDEVAHSSAEPKYYDSVRRFTTEDGLPQNSVNAIVQSQDGYLWLGTYGGLARFDGVRFHVFRSLSQNGLRSDRILSLAEDARKRIWVGTEGDGISVYDQGRFQHLPVCAGRCQVNAILVEKSVVYAATDVGLFRIAMNDFVSVRVGPEIALLFATAFAGQNYVVGFASAWRVQGAELLPIDFPKSTQLSSPSMFDQLDGQLILGLNADLYRLHANVWVPFDPSRKLANVATAVRDSAGHLWLSNLAGRSERQAGGKSSLQLEALELGTVRSHLLDREQNLWLGSNVKGLIRVRPARIAVLNDARHRFDLPGIAIADDGLGGLWFGLVCDGLRNIDAHGLVRSWPKLDALEAACPWALYQDTLTARGGLYIGTSDGALGYLKDVNSRVQSIAGWRANGLVRVITPATEDELFVAVGTQTYRVKIDANAVLQRRVRIKAVAGVNINRIQVAREGGHWFIGDQGIMRVLADQVVERWGPEQGLSNRFARSVFEEANGGIWIGTYGGGLNFVQKQGLDSSKNRVFHYHEKNGLYDDVASCILKDQRGGLWISGNRGISYISYEQRQLAGTVSNIDSVGFANADGLTSTETNGGTQSSCLRLAADLKAPERLWFPLLSGFAMLEPTRMDTSRRIALTPIIELVRLAGQEIDSTSMLMLNEKARNLEIHFAAPNLIAPEKTRFRFRLSSDREWTDAGTQRSVFYPTIPWGQFNFEVAANFAGGTWSTQVAQLKINHPLPWYQEPLSWVLIFVGIACMLVAARRALLWYLRRRAEAATRQLRQRADELARENVVLGEQARSDSLTGVANRRRFDEVLQHAWQQRAQQPLALLLIDVDEFKHYNDRFGHPAGDACLVAVADTLQALINQEQSTNQEYLLARYGGEEFVVLVRAVDATTASRLAEKLLKTVAALEIAHAPSAVRLHVTISIGVALHENADNGDLASLLARADTALYSAKALGRNRFEIAPA